MIGPESKLQRRLEGSVCCNISCTGSTWQHSSRNVAPASWGGKFLGGIGAARYPVTVLRRPMGSGQIFHDLPPETGRTSGASITATRLVPASLVFACELGRQPRRKSHALSRPRRLRDEDLC